MHMQVNCSSPLLLTKALLPLLRMADHPFVLTVTSLSAFWKKAAAPRANATGLYAASKRALLQQLLALGREMPQVDLLFAHPGVCATGLFLSDPRQSAYSPVFLRFALPLMKQVFPPPEKACGSILYAAQHAQTGQLAEPGGLLHIWGSPVLVPLTRRLKANGMR
jgi:NAD(P)-dependent dehydrogenase (short-subunit alcohol dehydrogenase family)